MNTIEMKEHSFGNTINTTFSLIFQNIGFIIKTMLILAAIVITIFAVVGGIVYFTESYHWFVDFFENIDASDVSSFFTIYFLIVGIVLLMYVLFMLFPAMVIQRLSDHYHGNMEYQPISVMIKEAIPRILPLFGTYFLTYLGIYLGCFLLIVPGIIFGLAWSVTIPAVVIEKKGPIAAMKRSWHLTKGKRGVLLGMFIVFGLMIYAITMGITLMGGLFSVLFTFLSPALGSIIYFIVSFASAIIVHPLNVTFPMVIYYNLRIAKEGYGVSRLEMEFNRPMEGPES